MATALKQGDFDCLLTVIWAICSARNDKFWGFVLNSSPSGVVQRATDWWQNFLQVTATPPHSVVSVVPQWSCPPSGRLKVNVDGAWNTYINLGGVGIDIRDSEAMCIVVATRIFNNFPN